MDKLANRICHITKILRNDLLPAKGLLHFAEQIDSRAFFPVAANGIFRTVRNRKILIKTTEMVNSYHIIKAEHVTQSGDPPLISCISVIIPAVQRISPELSCCGKSIWRASGYSCWHILLIQLEKLRMSPGIRTVHSYIDRNIPNDLDTFFIGIFFQFHPLFIEFKLHILLEFNIKIQLSAVIVHSVFPAETDILRPFGPLHTAKLIFHSHKKCIVGKPPVVFRHESLIIRILADVAVFVCFAEKFIAAFVNLLVVYAVRPFSPVDFLAFLFCKNSLFHQSLQADKVRISRKSGKGLVRRISVACRAKGKDLPVALSCFFQPVHKIIGTF